MSERNSQNSDSPPPSTAAAWRPRRSGRKGGEIVRDERRVADKRPGHPGAVLGTIAFPVDEILSTATPPPWILPVVPAHPDPVYLLSSLFGLQADCHQLLDAQPPKPVLPATNCLPLEKHRPVHPKLTSPPRLLNPPATVLSPVPVSLIHSFSHLPITSFSPYQRQVPSPPQPNTPQGPTFKDLHPWISLLVSRVSTLLHPIPSIQLFSSSHSLILRPPFHHQYRIPVGSPL
ncbi:hypothetical protein CRENBAI_023264 [Crenichthys baileyi]|uniref:Uncharacterized protein n=1 Tax=Crenichthys baileyi TaxID=28760 RepID=A0AAV9R6B5_9TELE